MQHHGTLREILLLLLAYYHHVSAHTPGNCRAITQIINMGIHYASYM